MCRVLLQVPQSVWLSETLSCPWARPETCTCSCTCHQTKSQVQVTRRSHIESTQDLGFGKCWDGTSSVGPPEGQHVSISPPWCLFLREHDLIDPDSWNKAAIHSRRGRGSVWGEEFYLLRCFLWAEFNITSSHSHLLQAGTAQNITVFFLFNNRSIFYTTSEHCVPVELQNCAVKLYCCFHYLFIHPLLAG